MRAAAEIPALRESSSGSCAGSGAVLSIVRRGRTRPWAPGLRVLSPRF